MKIVKRSAAVVLALLMMFTMFAVSSSAAKKQNYLLLGDSIAYGQGLANSQDACYGKIVADTNGYNYKNYAVSGTTSGALLAYIDQDFVTAGVKEANIISISIGGNDFLTQNLPLLLAGAKLGIDAQFDYIEGKFAENFADIIAKIKKINPSVSIFVQTVYNPNDSFVSDAYQKGVDVLNGVIKNYLSSHKGAFRIVDVEKAFAGHHEYIASDTIHPNAKGNLVIAKETLKALKSAKLGSTTTPVVKTEAIDWNNARGSYGNIFSYYFNLILGYIGKIFA